jgi:DNA invertase Pin-like site-specific DNA recombinase
MSARRAAPRSPGAGRALFYTRDSGGRHETTPTEYVAWAAREAAALGLAFDGSPARIEAMIRGGRPVDGDLYLDYDVRGDTLSRPGLDALIARATSDPSVTHVFIPRRDRLARPDHAMDGVQLECRLRLAGVTLVFKDKVAGPIRAGRTQDIADLITAAVDYHQAGGDRRRLAQQIIDSQLRLARAGFSTGGRAPFGFRRWLARVDGTAVRPLQDGERVRMAGHHVVWLPDEEKMPLVGRILDMVGTMPASRVAATLTAEGVPAPDAGRTRKDGGVPHPVSGVWHQSTIRNIAENSLLVAVVTHGRRSMGDRLRFTAAGQRELEESDFRPDGEPKVVANPPSAQVTAPARFGPVISAERHEAIKAELRERGGTQRGKPRSRDPGRNPLGTRVYDLACGWPMYRVPYGGSFRYTCGLYQTSHSARCSHNHLDGPAAVRFALSVVRQTVLASGLAGELERRLRALAEAESGAAPDPSAARREELERLRAQRDAAGRNLALAATPAQYRAVAAAFEDLNGKVASLEAALASAPPAPSPPDPEAGVAAAMAVLDRLPDLAFDGSDLPALGELFAALDVRMFCRFVPAAWGRRTVNRLAGGVVTLGSAPPPIEPYRGPTAREEVKALAATAAERGVPKGGPPPITVVTGQEGGSSGNVGRGDRI